MQKKIAHTDAQDSNNSQYKSTEVHKIKCEHNMIFVNYRAKVTFNVIDPIAVASLSHLHIITVTLYVNRCTIVLLQIHFNLGS